MVERCVLDLSGSRFGQLMLSTYAMGGRDKIP